MISNQDSPLSISDLSRSHAAIRLAEADLQLTDGADEFLQLLATCSSLARLVATDPHNTR